MGFTEKKILQIGSDKEQEKNEMKAVGLKIRIISFSRFTVKNYDALVELWKAAECAAQSFFAGLFGAARLLFL